MEVLARQAAGPTSTTACRPAAPALGCRPGAAARRGGPLPFSSQHSGRGTVALRAIKEPPSPSPLDSISLRSIDNLDTDYCDDFVCTSSPAIEQTVRSLARELTRGR